jgi:hypothetical protein
MNSPSLTVKPAQSGNSGKQENGAARSERSELCRLLGKGRLLEKGGRLVECPEEEGFKRAVINYRVGRIAIMGVLCVWRNRGNQALSLLAQFFCLRGNEV